MADLNSLNNLQMDVFKEIGSIGSGNAVTALSKLLGKRVTLVAPVAKLLEFRDVHRLLGDAETVVYAVLQGFSGDLNGMMMFIVNIESATALVGAVLQRTIDESEIMSELGSSALMEIGNILVSSYLAALGTLTAKRIVPTVPFLTRDMAAAVLSVPAIEFGKIADKALFIESLFGGIANLSGYFILVPDMPSLNLILSSLGVS